MGGFSERSNIRVDVDMAPDFGRLPSELETAAFRIVQECLTNIHRHSGSDRARIAIVAEAGRIVVTVQDWGKGIPADKLLRVNAEGLPGVGFRGMTERLRHLGGSLRLESDGTGTIVTATIPVAKSLLRSYV